MSFAVCRLSAELILGHRELGKEHKHCSRVAAINAITTFAEEASLNTKSIMNMMIRKARADGAEEMRERCVKTLQIHGLPGVAEVVRSLPIISFEKGGDALSETTMPEGEHGG